MTLLFLLHYYSFANDFVCTSSVAHNPNLATIITATPKLPPGWEMLYTAQGKPYYVDHTTKKTFWELPNPML